jgi:hypothetical protein
MEWLAYMWLLVPLWALVALLLKEELLGEVLLILTPFLAALLQYLIHRHHRKNHA